MVKFALHKEMIRQDCLRIEMSRDRFNLFVHFRILSIFAFLRKSNFQQNRLKLQLFQDVVDHLGALKGRINGPHSTTILTKKSVLTKTDLSSFQEQYLPIQVLKWDLKKKCKKILRKTSVNEANKCNRFSFH